MRHNVVEKVDLAKPYKQIKRTTRHAELQVLPLPGISIAL
jgi:hypothetical protein